MNKQPGFKVEWTKVIKTAFIITIYTDILARMYYSTAFREKNKNETKKVLEKYLEKVKVFIKEKSISKIKHLLEEAIEEFNKIEVLDKKSKTIAIIGEIYLKYNNFANNNIIEWLTNRNIEVKTTPLLNFFLQSFINTKVNTKAKIEKSNYVGRITMNIFEILANRNIKAFDKIYSKYRYYEKIQDINILSNKASELIDITNQSGEGWLIAGEIADFVDKGVKEFVCIQPFGCLANQVSAKGIEKNIRKKYKDINITYIDYDHSTSEANITNRLHCLL